MPKPKEKNYSEEVKKQAISCEMALKRRERLLNPDDLSNWVMV